MFCRTFKSSKTITFYLCERWKEGNKVRSKDTKIIVLNYNDITSLEKDNIIKMVNGNLKQLDLYSQENSELVLDKLLDLKEQLDEQKEIMKKIIAEGSKDMKAPKELKVIEKLKKITGINESNN